MNFPASVTPTVPIDTSGAVPIVTPVSCDDQLAPWESAVKRFRQLTSVFPISDANSREVGQLLAGQPGVVAAVLLRYTEAGQIAPSMPLVCRREYNSLAAGWQETIRGVAESVQRERSLRILRLPQHATKLVVIAVPIVLADRVPFAVCLIAPDDAKVIATLQPLVTGIVHSTPHKPEVQPSTTSWFEVLAQANNAPSLEQSLGQIATALQNRLGCGTVLLGICRGMRKRCQLVARSGEARVERRTALALECEEVFAESIARGEISAVTDTCHSHHATSPTKALLRTCSAATAISGPLSVRPGQPLGAWVALDYHANTGEQSPRSLSPEHEADVSNATLCVDLLVRSQPGWRTWLRNALWNPDHRQRNRTLAIIGAVIIGGMLVPLPYQVKTACEAQPVTRRFIPVPYHGVLKDVEVEPGDIIREGQVLARMDDREIDWELAAKQADYERAKKQHDISLAQSLTAEAQLAKLEMERLDVQIQLLRDRIQNLEIRSPIHGVVISGDPSKRQGARLNQGDTLFEVGPLERMLVEFYVPDREVSHVRLGQPALVRLDAFAGRQFSGELVRVSPSAVPREQENVFVAEIELENPKSLLRPGMSGHGKISTSRHTLGWILFHKAWRAVVQRFD